MGVLLLIVSVALSVIISPVAGFYSMYVYFGLLLSGRGSWAILRLNEVALAIAIVIDILGNVLFQDLFNAVLIKGNGYKFGSTRMTISAVLGYNKEDETLTPLGIWVANALNKLDLDHVEIAANFYRAVK